MKVLVTGGAGLIGMNLRAELKRLGHEVTATDITDFGRNDPELVQLPLDESLALTSLVQRCGIEAIVHAGAISGPMLSRDDPMMIVKTNITATANLIEAARQLKVKRFVFCSSVSVYGNGGDVILDERMPLRPTSLYGASKVVGEQLLRGFSADHGISGISLRIARVYGPYRRGNCPIQSMILAAAEGQSLELVGDTTFPYHFIHVDDVVHAIILALEQEQTGVAEFNVGAPSAQTLPEIIAAARETVPQLSVQITPGENDVPDYQRGFETKKIAAIFGWQPKVDLKSGIEQYRKFLSV